MKRFACVLDAWQRCRHSYKPPVITLARVSFLLALSRGGPEPSDKWAGTHAPSKYDDDDATRGRKALAGRHISPAARQARGWERAQRGEPLTLPLVVPVLRPPFSPAQHSEAHTARTPPLMQRHHNSLRSLAARGAVAPNGSPRWAPRSTPAARSRP